MRAPTSIPRIYAQKLTLDASSQKKNIFFKIQIYADNFDARTRKFSKIEICDILIINFVIFKNFGLSVSKNG